MKEIDRVRAEVAAEKERAEALLENVLPAPIAEGAQEERPSAAEILSARRPFCSRISKISLFWPNERSPRRWIDNVAPAKLAVDCKIEQRQIPDLLLHLELGPDGADVFRGRITGPNVGFAPESDIGRLVLL